MSVDEVGPLVDGCPHCAQRYGIMFWGGDDSVRWRCWHCGWFRWQNVEPRKPEPVDPVRALVEAVEYLLRNVTPFHSALEVEVYNHEDPTPDGERMVARLRAAVDEVSARSREPARRTD